MAGATGVWPGSGRRREAGQGRVWMIPGARRGSRGSGGCRSTGRPIPSPRRKMNASAPARRSAIPARAKRTSRFTVYLPSGVAGGLEPGTPTGTAPEGPAGPVTGNRVATQPRARRAPPRVPCSIPRRSAGWPGPCPRSPGAASESPPAAPCRQACFPSLEGRREVEKRIGADARRIDGPAPGDDLVVAVPGGDDLFAGLSRPPGLVGRPLLLEPARAARCTVPA